MIDSRSLLSLPGWVRITLVVILSFVIFSSVFIAISFVGEPSKSDWILLAMTIAQSALTIFSIGMVIIFGQTGTSVDVVKQKAELFLNKLLPNSLEKISLDQGKQAATKVEVTESSDIFGKNYNIHFPSQQYKFWFGLNVHRIFTIYFVPVDYTNKLFLSYAATKNLPLNRSHFSNWLQNETFQFTFGGAKELNYKLNFEPIQVSGEEIVSIWATVETDHDFLISPNEKLFWANDIAMMTESFLRTAARYQLNLNTICSPKPL